eukprot:Sspe_Gene.115072::Locus_101971_Transcript_2_5_Confidence_0.667_Length_541::g.115072::m.115072
MWCCAQRVPSLPCRRQTPVSSDGTGRLEKDEVPAALGVWYQYHHPDVLLTPELEDALGGALKHFPDKLCATDIASLMTALNEGIRPTDDEIRYVLHTVGLQGGLDDTGFVPKAKVKDVLAVWYTSYPSQRSARTEHCCLNDDSFCSLL